MGVQSLSKLGEVAFALKPQTMRIRERHFAKVDLVVGAQLRRDRQIDRDHVRDFWIAADRLAISEKQNRFSARRHLHCSGRDCFGNKIARSRRLQFRSIEAYAHAVGIRRNDERFVREALKRRSVEAILIGADNEPQDRLALRWARPIVRRFPTRDSLVAQSLEQNHCAFRILAERKFVTVVEWTAIESAEVSSQISGATAKNNRHVDAAGNGEPGATSGLWSINDQLFACACEEGVTRRDRDGVDAHFEFSAAPGGDPILAEPQMQTAERYLESSSRFIIADE